MNEIEISVIVPIYKVEKYIEKCLHSLFQQTLKDNIEFIFIDDSSPDKSYEILIKTIADYPQRKDYIKIIRHDSNQGVGQSRKDGLKECRGNYIIHCDPDDWLEINAYETLLKTANTNQADIVICNYFINTDTKEVPFYIQHPTTKDDYINKILQSEIKSYLHNKLIKKKLYDKLNPTFIKGLDFWEDVSVIARLFYYSNKISFVTNPLYHYYNSNPNSYTNNTTPSQLLNILTTLNINYIFFKGKNYNYSSLITRGALIILRRTRKHIRKEYKKELFSLYKDQIKTKYCTTGRYDKTMAFLLFNNFNIMANFIIDKRTKFIKIFKRLRLY